MTLSPRHRIRNSSPGGLRSSTLPLGHGGSPRYWLFYVDGEETFFVSFKPPRPGTEPQALAWKAAVLTTTLGPPPLSWGGMRVFYDCVIESVIIPTGRRAWGWTFNQLVCSYLFVVFYGKWEAATGGGGKGTDSEVKARQQFFSERGIGDLDWIFGWA